MLRTPTGPHLLNHRFLSTVILPGLVRVLGVVPIDRSIAAAATGSACARVLSLSLVSPTRTLLQLVGGRRAVVRFRGLALRRRAPQLQPARHAHPHTGATATATAREKSGEEET